ncbi:MAG: LCP family protein [Chloroflexi bacterium]|nr:LCP family protein [Chloroflexota bacterium]
MTTPDLEPTQRLPTVGDEPEYQQQSLSERERRGSGLAGLLGRVILLLLIAILGVVAAALLLTPPRESILIMGSDARPDELRRGEVGRTDTLLLFVGDRALPRVAMLSVPRDLWVQIPGYGEERINAAYEMGGPQTAKQTVSNVIGQPVDRYVVIGLQGVRDVVDAVGGVDITVPQAIHDDAYPTDDYGYQTVDIPAGRQHMDGDTALKYARTRHQDSDFARAARQQQVVAAVRNAMLNPLNWPRTPAVLAAVASAVKTDITPLDVIAVEAAMLRDPGDPDHLVIDTSLASEVTGEDGAYLLQAKPTLKPAVAQFLAAPTVSPASISVEVLNGAGVTGLAARTADRLKQAGFTVANVADAPRAQPQTTIVARASARSAADQIASAVGLPASRVSTGNPTNADVQITLGADAR